VSALALLLLALLIFLTPGLSSPLEYKLQSISH
jgi:hypothetical protein